MRLSSIDTMQRCSSCISKRRHQFEGGDKNARQIRTLENVIIQQPAAGCNMLKCWWNATLVFLIGRDAKQCKCLRVFSCKSFTYFRPRLYPRNALHVWCARRISNMPWRAQVWQIAVSSLPDSGLGYSLLSLKNSLFSLQQRKPWSLVLQPSFSKQGVATVGGVWNQCWLQQKVRDVMLQGLYWGEMQYKMDVLSWIQLH